MRCQYCGTEPINSTTKKGLRVCCCYMLHFIDGKYIQHHKCKKPEYIAEKTSKNNDDMKECKKCLHYDVCSDFRRNICETDQNRFKEYRLNSNGVCDNFKSAADYTLRTECSEGVIDAVLNYVIQNKGFLATVPTIELVKFGMFLRDLEEKNQKSEDEQ